MTVLTQEATITIEITTDTTITMVTTAKEITTAAKINIMEVIAETEDQARKISNLMTGL